MSAALSQPAHQAPVEPSTVTRKQALQERFRRVTPTSLKSWTLLDRLAYRLRVIGYALANLTACCLHQNSHYPSCFEQRCLDCGSVRYFDRSFVAGFWHKEVR